jgi:uncharacterized protein
MKNIQTKLFRTVTEKVKQTALSFDENAQVILFGSRARGDYRKDSDWDFLILIEKPVDEPFKRKIRDNILETELETDQCISSLIENKTEWEDLEITDIYQNIAEDGISI